MESKIEKAKEIQVGDRKKQALVDMISEVGPDAKNVPEAASEPGTLFRIKSYMLTKLGESRLGRQVIFYFVGAYGDAVFTNLEAAVARQQGGQQAEKLTTYIIRFAIKCKLLHDNRNITQKDVFHLADPCNALVLNLHENFELAETGDSKAVDILVLNRQCMRVRDHLMDIVRPHMTAKECAKLNWVMSVLGSVEFLESIYLSPDFKEERDNIRINLVELVEPLLYLDAEDNRCQYASCKRLMVQMDPPDLFENFRQLHYCPKHHFKLYMNLQDHPAIFHFLKVDPDYEPFKKFKAESLPPNYAAFYRGAGNFQVCKSGQRKIFSMLVYEKYFQKKAKAPLELPADLRADIEKEWKAPTVDTYTAARNYVGQVINEVFLKVWVPSPAFAEYLVKIKLPDIMMQNYLKHYGG